MTSLGRGVHPPLNTLPRPGSSLETDPVPPGRPRRGARTAAVVVAVILALLVASVVGVGLFVQHRLSSAIDRFGDPFADLPERPAAAAPGADDEGAGAAAADPVNLLLLGTDSRISAGDPAQWALGAQRTDAMMIVQVSGDRRGIYVMSIPRDAWVEVPGHGRHKINAAFSFGGPALTVHTVETLTGIPIDHVAIADFESFAALTDTLGGVEITLAEDLQLRGGGGTIAAGTQVLDGEAALSYTRQRHGLPGGDFDRVQRQQNWVRAMGRAALDRDVLTDPPRLLDLLESIGRTVAVDESLTMTRMTSLALSMRNLDPEDVVFMTAPHTGVGRSPDGAQSIVNLDAERLAGLSRAFATDDVRGYLAEHAGEIVTLGSHAR